MNDFRNDPNEYPPGYERQQARHPSMLHRLLSRDDNNLQIVLFLLTIGTTYLISQSLLYSAAIIAILLAHEMGHYVMCRKHGISATLPYFMPMPIGPFGTLGAVIAMRQVIPNRRALFDVAVAGPLAGLMVAVPVIVIGLQNSTIINPEEFESGLMTMGEPLAFRMIKYFVFGAMPEGQDVLVHPLAYAGWVGLFITALNLLPVGQLDGGHIAYAMFGRNSKYIFVAALIFFAISTLFFLGWIIMLILLTLVFFRHPPTGDDITPLDPGRRRLGAFMFIIFALTFTPVPFQL